jgi:hypothetical protein
MKTCGGMEIQLHAFLFLALDGDESPAARPGRLLLVINLFFVNYLFDRTRDLPARSVVPHPTMLPRQIYVYLSLPLNGNFCFK